MPRTLYCCSEKGRTNLSSSLYKLLIHAATPQYFICLCYYADLPFKYMVCRTCEICGSVALNVAGVNEAEMMEQWNEANDTATAMVTAAPVHPAETRNFWQGHRFLNFLLACMVFAFVISWLFHFNVPS